MEKGTYKVACFRVDGSEQEVACDLTLMQASDLANEYARFDKVNAYVVINHNDTVVWGFMGRGFMGRDFEVYKELYDSKSEA